MSKDVLVVGLGEIGKPLFDLIKDNQPAVGIDLEPIEYNGDCSIMHVCFPFDFDKFIDECKRYIGKYRPGLTIINSTVAPGTTRRVQQETGCRVVNSPIRGKHWKMRSELSHYTKYIGGTDVDACLEAEAHFRDLGMKTKIVATPETSEIAKLSETTYFGLLVTWAQEVERYCDNLDCNYDDVVSFYEEISFLPPVKYTPGVIGGHCVMPNVEILRQHFQSDLLEAMEKSNELKQQREAHRNAITSSSCSSTAD